MNFICLLLLIVLSACSFKKDHFDNQVSRGHSELYSHPGKPISYNETKYKRIVIAATNDLQGFYHSTLLEIKDKHNKSLQKIRIGGSDYISSYFKTLKQKYQDVVLLDSGNILPLDTKNLNQAKIFYEHMNYDALTIGLDDFNFKFPRNFKKFPDFIQNYIKNNKTPVLINNIWDIKTAQPVNWPGTSPSMIKEVNGIKIGIIGIIPDDISSLTSVDGRLGLFIEDMTQSTLRSARLLRSQGAELVVVMTNQNIICGEELAQKLNLPLSKVNFEPRKANRCNLTNSTGEWLKRLPPQLVDLVITGRTEHKTVNYVGETLILNGLSQGRGFAFAEFFFDKKTGKLKKEQTLVHQPILFCQKFFKETNDCYSADPSVDHHELIEARFLGEIIKPDSTIPSELKKYSSQANHETPSLFPFVRMNLDSKQGDLSFVSGRHANAKLLALEFNGKELMQILEKDFNHKTRMKRWIPNPFLLRGDKIELLIKGLPIKPDEKYRIVANIKDVINHPDLRFNITKSTTISYNHNSWPDQTNDSDEISSSMSALETVR